MLQVIPGARGHHAPKETPTQTGHGKFSTALTGTLCRRQAWRQLTAVLTLQITASSSGSRLGSRGAPGSGRGRGACAPGHAQRG